MTITDIEKAADKYAESVDIHKQTTAVQDFIAGAQWMMQQLKQAPVINLVCDHDRHYSEIDGFAYCNKCGAYMQ